jgi:hypothetical protein
VLRVSEDLKGAVVEVVSMARELLGRRGSRRIVTVLVLIQHEVDEVAGREQAEEIYPHGSKE